MILAMLRLSWRMMAERQMVTTGQEYMMLRASGTGMYDMQTMLAIKHTAHMMPETEINSKKPYQPWLPTLQHNVELLHLGSRQ